ncbi:SRPBCC domain-containing protein [Flavobacterium sp. J372]|uniref:SRPBCC family protein n=1 Tax=Flavobacterium sp. J372 TaxID=2898436 RepID=UPI002150B8E6|nr:SRPBCC domain-containing protein [Flavobacterium sp. J372]
MKNDLLFDFNVNKENKTIIITREFAAGVALVWKAWTTPELLDQWWGPQPWRAETKSMDFTEGGYWLYAMVGPRGPKALRQVNIYENFAGRIILCESCFH